MSETFSKWRVTPWWLRLLGKPTWMRDRFASPMIGGGWDGWEFTDNIPPPTGPLRPIRTFGPVDIDTDDDWFDRGDGVFDELAADTLLSDVRALVERFK